MFTFIGVSFVAGLGVTILSIGVNLVFTKFSMKYYYQTLAEKDKRTRSTEELFK
jgi:hypothetical protein